MKEIKLTGKYANGRVALVDDEDYEELNKYKWGAYLHHSGSLYTRSNIYNKETKKCKCISMHVYLLGTRKGLMIDHIDRNPLNNQKSNLRVVTNSQNMMNMRMRSDKTQSKYKGVFTTKIKKGKYSYWKAEIVKDGTKYSKHAMSEVEAAIAYNKMATELFGEYANLNIIDPADKMYEKPLTQIEQIIEYLNNKEPEVVIERGNKKWAIINSNYNELIENLGIKRHSLHQCVCKNFYKIAKLTANNGKIIYEYEL